MKSTERLDNREELLELYKLHAELADKVSERRGGANRLYAGLLSGAAIFATVVIRFGGGDIHPGFIIVIGFLGYFLSWSWVLVIRAYRQLNKAKFAVLFEMEKHLSYQFFQEEWDILLKKKGEIFVLNFRSLTFAEILLPLIFGIFFTLVIYYGYARIDMFPFIFPFIEST